jgi:hypoxanthine phosphoribosyltransferase
MCRQCPDTAAFPLSGGRDLISPAIRAVGLANRQAVRPRGNCRTGNCRHNKSDKNGITSCAPARFDLIMSRCDIKAVFKYNELTHLCLSGIEQNGVISSLKRIYGTNRDVQLRLVYSKEEISSAVKRVADEISRDYEGQELLLVVVLKGAFIFAADLARMLRMPISIDFTQLASYSGMESNGTVRMLLDVDSDVAGKNILVVEDIIDTGSTLDYLLRNLATRGPKSLKVCTLIDRRERRRIAVAVDYAGLECNRGFLVGYGLDLDEDGRELEAIYEVADLPSSGGLNDNSM